MNLCRVLVVLAGVGMVGGVASGQCGGEWLPGPSVAGVDGGVSAATWWDSDGPGPAPARPVMGGTISMAGDALAAHVAVWDESTGRWTAVGGPDELNGSIYALATLGNGDLVAGGAFRIRDGSVLSGVARWNGANWVAMGAGATGNVNALLPLPNGQLMMAQSGDGLAAAGVRKWDPLLGWTSATITNAPVLALARTATGQIVAGGEFTLINGVAARRVAVLSGTTWSALGPGLGGAAIGSEFVRSFAALPDGRIVAGGLFAKSGTVTVNNVATWTGTAWQTMESGFQGTSSGAALGLAVLPNGDVIAVGDIAVAGGRAARNVVRWDGAGWSDVGGGTDAQASLAWVEPSGGVIVGGGFLSAGGVAARGVARWDTAGWSALGPGSNERIDVLLVTPGGDVIAGGPFRSVDGTPANGVARWDGAVWSPLGSGMTSDFVGAAVVESVAVLGNGDVVAGGLFSAAGGVEVFNIARWDGAAWHEMGLGADGQVNAMVVRPGGELICGGFFESMGGVDANFIARWDGESWAPLGAGLNGAVSDLVVMPDGSVVASGGFTLAGGVEVRGLARWTSETWTPIGGGLSSGEGTSLLAMPNGDLIVIGGFFEAGGVAVERIARWDGSNWSSMGLSLTQPASAIALLGEDVVVLSVITPHPGPSIIKMDRWNGTSWTSATFPVRVPYAPRVSAVAVLPSEELMIGGKFSAIDSRPSAFLARWTDQPAPWIARQPEDIAAETGMPVAMVAETASGYARRPGGLSYQWRRNGVPISDGPGGASAGGGAVSGASGALTEDGPAVLMIEGARPGDAGDYDCLISNDCGSAISDIATLTITGSACPADLNGDGVVDFADYLEFLNLYDGLDPRADLNGDGIVDFADYLEFLNDYDAGC